MNDCGFTNVFSQVMQFNILNPNSVKHRATEKYYDMYHLPRLFHCFSGYFDKLLSKTYQTDNLLHICWTYPRLLIDRYHFAVLNTYTLVGTLIELCSTIRPNNNERGYSRF